MLKKITLVCFLFCYLIGFAHTELWLAPSATITGGGTVCQNSTGPTLTFTGSGGVAPYTFTYTVNGGAQQTLTTTTGSSATLIAPTSASGSFTYQLVSVSDSSNPVQTATATGSVTVNVLAQPDATMGGTGAGTVFNGTHVFRVCTNATSNFTFTNTSSKTGTNLNDLGFKLVLNKNISLNDLYCNVSIFFS